MLQTMPTIGAQIRQQMPWIPRETPTHLILDNAGGHGARAAIEEYTRRLRNDHNVTVQEAWRDLPADTIQRVFNRIPVVHQLIVESGGDNIKVEERRGCRNIAVAPE